ncbi:MAG: hypothetical protein Q8R60_01205 [Mycobacteriales bacterium]|nr:hypothetical protein [Mycobacteriales bacterium]
MTGPAVVPCPSCGAPLTGGPACPACALPLTGPAAQRLWQVDQALLAVDAERGRLLAERTVLLTTLRTGADPGTTGSLAPAGQTWAPPPPRPIVHVAPRPAEWTPQRVQNLLLGLGALLLAVAATVFAAVTYDRLGAGGRAAVLVALTGVALGVVPVLLRRGLTASAETATGVALVLAALDAYGLRTLGVGDDLEATTYAAIAAALLAAGSAGWAAAFPLRLPRVAAVVVAQLPPLLLLASAEASAATTGLVLVGLAACDVAVAHALRGRSLGDVVGTSVGAAVAAASGGLLLSLGTAVAGQDRGATGLVALAALCAVAALLVRDTGSRLLLSGAPVPLLGVAAWSLARPDLTSAQEPLVAAAVGVLAAQVAALLPRAWRTGPVVGALVVAEVGVAVELRAVLEAVGGPVGWLVEPWTVAASAQARDVVSPGAAWSGSVVTLVVLLAAAVTTVTAAAALHRLEQGLAPAALLAVASGVLLPLGLATSLSTALVLLVVVATALAAGAVAVGRTASRPAVELALLGAAGATALLAAAWSTASEGATLATLPVLVGLLVAVSVAVSATSAPAAQVSAGCAGLLAGATLAAFGAAQELAVEQVGGLLLLAPTALLGLSLVTRRVALEVAAAVLAVVTLTLAAEDPGWLSWCLAGAGLLALALALRPDRRWAAVAGALLLAASSWVRLADAGVEAPEPYVVPLGLVALGLGHLRRRAVPATGSLAAYSSGLGLLLLPSLVYALGDEELLRSVLLLGVSAVVLLAGVAGRLRAPLLFGGGVLAVDAVHLLAPYAAALPRWMPLAAVGLALVVLGATYEQRRRDLTSLRDRLDAFA